MKYDWRRPHTWPLTRKLVVLMVAATYLPLGYALYGWGSDTSASALVSTEVRVYELPKDVQSARASCYETERETRGVPAERNAYLSWWRDNEGTATQLEWTAAFEACKTAHPMPGGKWNFAGMTLVKTEVIP